MGGVNTFEEQELAIREMFRVARTSARIIIVDEGLNSKLRNTRKGEEVVETKYTLQLSTSKMILRSIMIIYVLNGGSSLISGLLSSHTI